MWVLSCDGDLLDGKSIWLRPGSQHLLGRTTGRSEGEQLQYIDHKSISRKHLMIKVEPLLPGASRQLHARSKITLEDSSKSGTFINGERLSKAKKDVDKTETKIQLGSSSYIFHIIWRPVVLTFTNLTSAQKKQDDPLQEYRDLLEHADIKLFPTYLSGTTTHVVATGRNNPACLQALAQAKWTVQYAWISRLAEIVKIESMEVTKTPLESDFAAAWPSETQALVPTANEPTPRSEDFLMPDKRRSELFSGLTYVFQTEKQHVTLMPVVTAAGGKAILSLVDAPTTDVDDYVTGIKTHFSTKKNSSADAIDLARVVIVRAEPNDDLEWWDTFTRDLEGTLGRRCISQSEFLDVILTLDVSALYEAVPITRTPSVAPRQQSVEQQSADTNGATQLSGKNRRYAARSRFQGFDDFDPSQVVRIASQSPEPPQAVPVADIDAMEVGNVKDEPRTRKRPAHNVADILEKQLGPSEAKRQRLDDLTAKKTPPPVGTKPARSAKSRVPDVKAILAEQKKKEAEEDRLREEQRLDNQLEGLTVADMQQFVQHEEFEVVMPQPTEQTPIEQHARPGWDPSWNYRKNFKAFRAQGQAQPSDQSRHQRVMVDLEELPSKTDAFFDEYFLDRSSERRDPASLPISNRDSNPADLSSYGTSLGQKRNHDTQQLAGLKRPLTDQSTNGSVAKRPRRLQQVVNLDEDSDDEYQFRRKRY